MGDPLRRDDIVDIASLRERAASPPPEPPGPRRPFLQIWFRCCHVYGRLYRNAAESHYEGRCPGCAARLEVAIGQGGTSRRAFEAS
jgi:hypothetical protein